MESFAIKPNKIQTSASAKKTYLKQFLLRWWVWGAIVLVVIAISYNTDFTAFNKGYHDGAQNKAVLKERSIAWWAVYSLAIIIVLGIFFGVQTLIARLYYKLFHRPILKNAQLGHLILFILCLLLAFNSLTDALSWLMQGYIVSKEKLTQKSYQELLAGSFAFIQFFFLIVYGFIADFRKTQKVQAALLQQKTAAELEALKAQVNPHFLFNTLNNLYGTAIGESAPQTADSIQQLSGIMRYVMQESQKQTTDIQNELRFIDDYIHLHEIRLPQCENIRITTDIVWDEQPAQIVPLLLNPLIENAFKYGISMEHPSFVHIRLRVEQGKLDLTIQNSIHTGNAMEKGTGTGLKNVRQRLELAYPDRHIIYVDKKTDTFSVSLIINL